MVQNSILEVVRNAHAHASVGLEINHGSRNVYDLSADVCDAKINSQRRTFQMRNDANEVAL